jgi:enamine deaminase RidA (YjgF/YER057c/UK114 family)
LISVAIVLLWIGSLLGLYFIMKPDKSINVISTDKAPTPLGPYTAGKRYNGMGFISGQIGIDPLKDEIVSDNIT